MVNGRSDDEPTRDGQWPDRAPSPADDRAEWVTHPRATVPEGTADGASDRAVHGTSGAAADGASDGAASDADHRSDLWAVSLSRQRRSWAWFVAAVGVALLGLCALDYSQAALVLGALLVLIGVVGALLPGRASGPPDAADAG